MHIASGIGIRVFALVTGGFTPSAVADSSSAFRGVLAAVWAKQFLYAYFTLGTDANR